MLVFDLQDVGTRVYTYVATMAYAMQAAAEAGIDFIVLDRPNPINGLATNMEGPVLEYPAYSSFIGLYPVPLRHSMTVGELARMIQSEFLRTRPATDDSSSSSESSSTSSSSSSSPSALTLSAEEKKKKETNRLHVVPMRGWSRSLYYDDCQLKCWVAPSPNMPTLETAIVYPGMVILEVCITSIDVDNPFSSSRFTHL